MRKFYSAANPLKTVALLFSFLLFAFWANAGTYYLTAAGAGNAQTPASWNTIAVGGGTAASNFTTNGDVFNIPVAISGTFGANTIFGSGASSGSGITIQVLGSITINNGVTITLNGKNGNNTSMTVTGTIILGATSKVSLNDNDSRNSFILLANATLKTANVLGVVGAGCSIEKTAVANPTVTLTNGANYEFNGTASQATLGLPTTPATINTLIINNAAGVNLTSTVTVNALTIGSVTANSILNDNGKQITSNGTFNLTSGTYNILFAGALAYPAFTINNLAASSTVNYNSASSQTIAAVNYGNLASINAPRILKNSGTIGIQGGFTPGSGAYTITNSTVSFNGTTAQTIPAFTFNNLIVNNAAGISSIGGNITVNNSLALTAGIVTTGASKIIIPTLGSSSRTTGWINGNFQKFISSTSPVTFEIGNSVSYSPVTVNYALLTTAGNLTATTITGLHPQIASSGLNSAKTVTRYWNLVSGGVVGNYSATFGFVAGDVPGGALTANFVVREYEASTWGTTVTGIKTATSTQATGLTGYGDFSIGEFSGAPVVSTPPSNVAVCLGNSTSITSATLSTPTPTVKWERSDDGGLTWSPINAGTDGGKYTTFTTSTLNISTPGIAMDAYKYHSIYTNINGTVTSTAATLTVTQAPTATLDYLSSPFANISAGPENPTLTGANAYLGGVYSSDVNLTINATTGAITPNTSTVGNHTVTYTIAAAGGCGVVTATKLVNITTAPTVTLTYSATAYCKSDNNAYTVTKTGTGAAIPGGTFTTDAGLSMDASGTITPDLSTVGLHTVTYHIPASGGFPASTSDVDVTITVVPAATITYSGGPFCSTDQSPQSVAFTGTIGAYQNGIFSSDAGLVLDATTGAFTPDGSTAGAHTITYTIPSTGGCAAVPVTTSVTIVARPVITFEYNNGNPLCLAKSPILPTVTPANAGIYSYVGSGLTLNTTTGQITPATSSVGDYDVTLTIAASGPCGIIQLTTTVSIVATPDVSIDYALQPYCTSDPIKPVAYVGGTGLYLGGTFSSTAGLAINAATGGITPGSSTPNTYVVTYAAPNACPVSFTAPVDINGSPTATISYTGVPFCHSDGGSKSVTLTGDNSGTFSAPLGLSIDGGSGDITPSTSTPGTYIVTYTIVPASVNCAPITRTTSVTITPEVGVPTVITINSGTQPTCQLTNGTTTTTYATTVSNGTGFNWSLSNGAAGSINPTTGVMTWANGFSGTVDIQVTANGCNGVSAMVTRPVTIDANNTASAGSSAPTLCINTLLTDITHTTTGATGIGTATGLPAGVTAIWSANTITISGTPTAPGTFNYSIPLTGGCSAVNATGTITVSPNNTVSAASSIPILCINTVLTNITHTTTGATGIGVATGLPAGVTAAWSANTITISGTPTAAGTFSYSIPLTGGCSSVNATGTITVNPSNTVGAASSTPTLCINTLLPNITHTTTGATGIGVAAGLPAGVTAAWSANTITISGTPTVAGLFSYSIPLTGGCSVANAVGTINVTPASIGGSITPTLISICSGTNTGTMTLSGYTGSIIRWEQSINAGSTWTPIANTAATYNTTVTQPTLFRAVVQNGVGICAIANSAAAQVIIDAPFTPVITASANPVCLGSSVTLTASNYTNTGLVVAGGDFASANPPGWNGASANNSNGDPNSGWGEANGGKAWNGVTYNSGGKFMIINGTGTPGNTSLTTPVFSLVGLSSAYLAFNQAYNLTALAQAQIQISIDGGGSYTTLQTYNGSGSAPGSIFGNPANFSADPKVFINLNAYLGMTNLVVKFLYTPQAGSNWAVDNIVVTNTTTNPSGTGVYNSVTYTWSPAANLSSTTGQSVTFNSVTSGAGSFPYSVTTTTSAAGCVSATPGTITVVVNPLPTIATTGTLAAVCFNAAAQTTTMPYTATTGTPTSYSIAWTGLANQGSTAFAFAAGGGTLTGIIIPAGTLAGTYSGTMTIINGNGCSSTQSVSLTVNGLPTIATTGTLTAVCTSAGAQTTTLVYTATTNSPTSYSIAWTGLANQGSTAFAFAAGGGTLTGITIPAGTLAGTYSGTMTIINANGCANTKAITITLNALPTLFTVTGGGNYCSGSTGLIVSLNGSQSGVSYQLQLGGVNDGSAIAGTGAAINFGLKTAAGVYTVVATNTSTTCSVAMTGSVTISINPLPGLFNVTGGGNYCAGGTGVVIGLDGSQSGVNYQLQIGGVNTGAAVAGTGSAISFGSKTVAGNYTVIATNATTLCTVSMSGAVTVTIDPLPTVTVAATAVCGGEPSTITATPGGPGTYSYVWTVPATATNPGNVASFTSTVTGNYSVVITNTITGCVSVASVPKSVAAVSNIWTGLSNASWQDIGNWSCAAVPTAITDVIIPTTAPNMPTLNAPSFSKSLELQGSAVITLNGQTLNNVGGITLTGTGLGSFIGSLTSSISINAPGTSSIINLQGNDGITNALKDLTIDGSGTAVTLSKKTALYGALIPTNGTLTLNDTLTLRSTSSVTARVGVVGGTILYSGAGRVTVERFNPARGWRLMTGPVYEGGSIYDNWQNKGIPASTAAGKGTLITGSIPSTILNGLDFGAPYLNPTLRTGNSVLTDVNDTKNNYLSKPAATTAANLPYFLYVRGDRNIANFTPGAYTLTTLSSTGKLQTGTQAFPADPTPGSFTMIGNPYASPVDFASLPRTELTASLYIWNPYQNITGAYITFIEDPLFPGTYTTVPASSPGNPSTILQSSQAFYVNNFSGGAASLVFNESNKSTISNPGGIFRPMSPATQVTSLSTNLYAFTNKDSIFLADGNLAQFDDSYNPGVDWMDAKKFTNTSETFSLLCNGVALAADRRPLPTMNDTLFYQLTRTTAKKYQFQLIANNLDRDNLAGFVQDQFTHKATPMNMNGTTKVNFAITSDKASAAANRFRVVFKPSVVYTNVAANVLASDIGVQWNVASEENIKGYEIERSTDGTHFTKVADQASAGNSDAAVAYNWLDVAPALGQYYYRIRSISYNDVIGYSNIVKVKLNRSTPAIYVFPNPVTENAIHLQMNGMEKGVYAARLINNLGQVVMSNYIAHMGGTATETLRPANRLLAGIYQLEIAAPDKKITTVKVIVQYNKQ